MRNPLAAPRTTTAPKSQCLPNPATCAPAGHSGRPLLPPTSHAIVPESKIRCAPQASRRNTASALRTPTADRPSSAPDNLAWPILQGGGIYHSTSEKIRVAADPFPSRECLDRGAFFPARDYRSIRDAPARLAAGDPSTPAENRNAGNASPRTTQQFPRPVDANAVAPLKLPPLPRRCLRQCSTGAPAFVREINRTS